MKIGYGSDLHLEIGSSDFKIPEGLDFLLLAGDIFTPWLAANGRLILQEIGEEQDKVLAFFKEVSDKVPQTYMVMGNHEHYHGIFTETGDLIRRDYLIDFPNISLLDNDTVKLGRDSLLFGATFWTDLKDGNPLVMNDCQRGMNDYHTITDRRETVLYQYPGSKGPKFLASSGMRENLYSRKKLTEFLSLVEREEKVPIIMTHHALSLVSLPTRFALDQLSYAYSNTGLDDILQDTAVTCIHGHIHDEIEIKLGKSLHLCNPRGYKGYENVAEGFNIKTFELDII